MDKKCLLTFFSVALIFSEQPTHQQLTHLSYIY